MGSSTLFEVEGLELHFLEEDGEFIFGGDFVEVKTVGFAVDDLLEYFLLLDFFYS